MGKITVTTCDIDGLYVIEPQVFPDARGYFFESYNEEAFHAAGLDMKFVQDNQSKSVKGVLRGCHFQKTHPQGKLVRVISGRVYDVAVDMRKNSPTLGKWFGVELTGENNKMFYIPEGFAHGFLVLSDEAVFTYKCTDFYAPGDEGGMKWDDPEVGIKWPVEEGMKVILSDKDQVLPAYKDAFKFG
jgi:dTDP-4-dehydrorhamnose 3,5-epimerase